MTLAVAAILLLVPAAHAALGDARQIILRLCRSRVLPERLASLHPRFGTPSHAIDLVIVSTILIMVASSAQVTWLSRAYVMGLGAALLIKIAVLLRFRRTRPGDGPFKASINLPGADAPARLIPRPLRPARGWPLGLMGTATLVGAVMLTVLVRGDGPSVTTAAGIAILCLLFLLAPRRESEPAGEEALDSFELLAPVELSLGHVEAGAGNVLVPVRNPHSLATTRVLGEPRRTSSDDGQVHRRRSAADCRSAP